MAPIGGFFITVGTETVHFLLALRKGGFVNPLWWIIPPVGAVIQSLAYVLSIHKSQESEFPCVVIPLHTQHYMMLQRNLLYTGVTRGKRLVVLVGTKKALGMTVHRQDTNRRFGMLRRRLQGK